MKEMIIFQGIPGSGKSSLAERLAHGKITTICCADDYHVNAKGEYKFSPKNIEKAHLNCLRNAIISCQQAMVPQIIVANTNVHRWEMAPYVQVGKLFEYNIHIVQCLSMLAHSEKRNVHSVPYETIARMNQNMEDPLPFWGKFYILLEKNVSSLLQKETLSLKDFEPYIARPYRG